MKELAIHNLIILDQSGSMMSIYDMALSSINETLQTIRGSRSKVSGTKQDVTIVTFSGDGVRGVKAVRNMVPVEEVKDLTVKDYKPDGCTPLYDAVGKSLADLQKQVGPEDKVLVTIITDGYENSSEEYVAGQIRSTIEQLRAKGWTFAFIGANQDAVLTAQELNIDNALNFMCSPEGMEEMSMKMKRSNIRWMDSIGAALSSNEELWDALSGHLFDDE